MIKTINKIKCMLNLHDEQVKSNTTEIWRQCKNCHKSKLMGFKKIEVTE